jgi:hypothetical protein
VINKHMHQHIARILESKKVASIINSIEKQKRINNNDD